MKIIEYESFEAAFKAMLDFMAKGIKCKGVGLTTLQVWIDAENRPFTTLCDRS